MRDTILTHLRHHIRFYASVLIGLLFYQFTPMLSPPIRLIAAGDVFFLVYLVAMAFVVANMTAKGLCEKAADED